MGCYSPGTRLVAFSSSFQEVFLMSFTSLSLLGFSTGCGFAALVMSVMSGFYSTCRALSEV